MPDNKTKMFRKNNLTNKLFVFGVFIFTALSCATQEFDASTTINFSFQSNIIVVRIRINGIPKDFLLDSGASHTTISNALSKELNLKVVEKVRGRGLGGEADVLIVHIDSIGVGNIILKDFSCAAMDFSNLAGLVNESVCGLLGYDFLSQFKLTIDYRARQVTFDKYKTEPVARFIITGDTFYSPKYKIKLVKPNQSWQINAETLASINVVILEKTNSSATIKIQAREMQGSTLDGLMPLVESTIKAQIENYQNISKNKKAGNAGEYFEFEYTGKKDGAPMQFKQVVFKGNEFQCNITYSTKVSEFQQSVKEFDDLIQSISFM